MTNIEQPGPALTASAAASAAFASLLALNPFFFLYAFPVALLHAFVLGLPIYSILRRRWRPTLAACLVGSFLIAAIPISSLLLLATYPENLNAWSGGTPTIVNGQPTAYHYVEAAVSAVGLGLLGLVGGITFWLVLRRPPKSSSGEG